MSINVSLYNDSLTAGSKTFIPIEFQEFKPSRINDWEVHVIKRHPGKIAYPGPVPLVTSQVLKKMTEVDSEFRIVAAVTLGLQTR